MATIELAPGVGRGVEKERLAYRTVRLFRTRRKSRRTRVEAARENGQAMVEFIIVLPLFLALLFVVIGYAVALSNYDRATDVARVGARAASIARFANQSPCNGGQLGSAAKTATLNAASGLTLMNGTPTCSCPGGGTCPSGTNISVTVTVQAQNVLTNIPFLSAALPGGSCQCWTTTATAVLQ